jgi:hypothetical protein
MPSHSSKTSTNSPGSSSPARVELIQLEAQRGSLLARGEEELRLDVVRAAELVALPQGEVPRLARRDPALDRGREDRQRLVDLNLDRRAGAFGRRGAGLDVEAGHGARVPAD